MIFSHHLFSCLLIVFPFIVPSQLSSSTGDTWAVVAGITEYEDDWALPAAAHNAMSVAHLLHHQGFPPIIAEKMILLLDEDATRDHLVKALKWVASHANRNDRIIFYFSGYASPLGLVPTDAHPEITDNHLLHATVQSILSRSSCRQTLMLYDVSHLFPVPASYPGAEVDQLIEQYRNQGLAILCSGNTRRDGFPRPDGRKSYFTHFFLRGIRDGAADRNGDSLVTLREAYEFSRLHVHIETGGQQTPRQGGDVAPDMVLGEIHGAP